MKEPTEETKISGFAVRTDLRAGKPLGDNCADIIHFTGLDRFAKLYTEKTGNDCGCQARQDWLNEVGKGVFK